MKKILLVVLPLLIAGLIYLSFRGKHLFYYQMIQHVGLENSVLHLRSFAKMYRKEISNAIIYSLPDGLWLFSFGIALMYGSARFYFRYSVFTFITIYMVLFEFIQKAYRIKIREIGTYDYYDIFLFLGAYIFASLICFLVYRCNKKSSVKKIAVGEEIFRTATTIIIFIILGLVPTPIYTK